MPIRPIQGEVIAVVDCLGDYREEVITSLKGELRIYSTTIPTKDRRVCLMQDHQYRMGVVAQTMGYYYPAQLGK
jgi:rhamnogalacturonan endolyase